MQIQSATTKDINKLIDVYSEWAKLKDLLPKALIEPETYNDLLKYFDGSNLTRIYFLALDMDGAVLGACYADVSFLSLNNIRLGDMMVKEKYRHQGVGSKLVEAVINYAHENDVQKIWLWTQEELEPATNFYQKMGFVLEARLEKQFCDKDALQLGLVL